MTARIASTKLPRGPPGGQGLHPQSFYLFATCRQSAKQADQTWGKYGGRSSAQVFSSVPKVVVGAPREPITPAKALQFVAKNDLTLPL